VVFEGEMVDLYFRRGYDYPVVDWEAKSQEGIGTLLSKGSEWHTLGFVHKEA